ncbi:MAG: hypothetical protein V1798_05805 [Pseudomonadota bacterium]
MARLLGYAGPMRGQAVRILAGLVFLGGVAAYLGGVAGLSVDDFTRLYVAFRWSRSPAFLQVAAWPPLFSVLYGTAFRFFGFSLFLAHLITAFCSALTIMAAATLAREISGEKLSGVFAALLVALAPLPAWLSASTLSEPLGSALFLWFIVFALRWAKEPSRGAMDGALLSGLLCTMTRLETWPWVIAFGAYAVLRKRDRRGLFMGLALWMFPLIWQAEIWWRFGHPLAEFRAHTAETLEYYAGSLGWRWIPLRTLLACFPAGMAFLVVLSGGRKHWPRHLRAFGVFVWVFAAVQLWALRSAQPTVFPERTVILPGLLSLVSLAAGLAVFQRQAGVPAILKILVIVVSLVASIPGFFRLHLSYDRELVNLGRRLVTSPILAQARGGIGTDISEGFTTLAAGSGSPRLFRRIYFRDGKLYLPEEDTPLSYLLESREALAALKSVNPAFSAVSVGRFELVSTRREVAEEFGRKKGL